MPKRRGNKEGSIFRRKDGRWCAQISIQGRRLTKYGKTQGECREWLQEIRNQIDEGMTVEGARTTMDKFLDNWLHTVKPSLRPNTWKQYAQIVNQHIKPDLGKIRLKDLRPDHIQKLYSSKLEAGTGVRTVRLTHAVLHRALNQALTWELVRRNPSDRVDLPKKQHQEMQALDVEHTRTFLQVTEGHRFEALFYLAISTGLRQGELLGLQWNDLDFETGKLQVRRQLQRVRGEGVRLVEPKTAAGRRSITLGPTDLAKLKNHRKRQLEDRLLAGGRWKEQGLIFPSTIGTPLESSIAVRNFKALLKKSDLPDIRFHDLRHTAATLMLQEGVHPKVVQERLGHSTISMTLDTYSHVLPNMQDDAVARMEKLLSGFRG